MRMTDAARIREFMFAGNATFTLVSVRTGTRFTYRLRKNTKKLSDTLYLNVLCAPELYRFVGALYKQPQGHYVFGHSRTSQLSANAPSLKAFEWFLEHIQDTDVLHNQLEFWHEGKCGKCGRALTVPASIATGLGPDCAAMMGVKMKEGVAA